MMSGSRMKNRKISLLRVMVWTSVAAYIVALPHVIFLYRFIVKMLPSDVVGKIPIVSIILLGGAYTIYGLLMKKGIRFLVSLLLCGVIAFFIILLEPVSNTHFHIPEYVFLSWLLFGALSIDYRGAGRFMLLFICTAMLGVVDEFLQGIHPERYYLFSDMVVNAASAVIGVIALMGIKPLHSSDWEWIDHLKNLKGSIGLVFFGVLAGIFMCYYLFEVQAVKTFWGVYPFWLFAWNILFFVLAAVLILDHRRRFLYQDLSRMDPQLSNRHATEVTVYLWIFCPLSILLMMHTVIFFIAVVGWEFR